MLSHVHLNAISIKSDTNPNFDEPNSGRIGIEILFMKRRLIDAKIRPNKILANRAEF